MKCTFKHTWSGISFNTIIDPNIPLNKLKENINQRVSSLMAINNNNYEIIIAGLSQKEMAKPIDLNSNKLFKTISKNAFYIRPTTEEDLQINNHLNADTSCLNECIVCNQNTGSFLGTWTSCTHFRSYCSSCITTWINTCQNNERIPNCPMCRRNIQR